MMLWLCMMALSLTWVIPAGHEAQLQQMLTPGPTWPAGWQLTAAKVQQDVVIASYQRGQEPAVQVRLSHPDAAPAGAVRTAKIAFEPGQLPEDVRAALRAQLEGQAGDWLWQAAAQAAPVGQASPATATAMATPIGDDPAVQLAAARAALLRTEDLPPLAQARAQLAIAWQLKGMEKKAADLLFLRHAHFAGQGAQATLVRWSAQLGKAGKAPDLEASDPSEAQELCGAATAVAGDVRRSDPSAALGLLAEVVKRVPTCRTAALQSVQIAQVIGSPEVAIAALQPLLAARPADLELAVTMANLERQAGRLEQGLQRLTNLELRKVPAGSPLVLPMTRVLIDAVGAQLPAALAFTVQIREQSDRDPNDSVAAFIAGTILHHSGDWQASNLYLLRSEKAFAQEPRQFLYSAMNHLQLGEQAEAERRVLHAFRMGTQDPDVWYCRAMIFARSHPQQSLADLSDYLAAVKGTADNPERKSLYVAKVMANLEACKDAGDAGRCLDLRKGRDWLVQQWYVLAGGLALLLAGVWLWRRRKAPPVGSAALLMVLAVAWATLCPDVALAQSGVREAVAPLTLEAQLSWHTPLELLQVVVSLALLAGGVVFFCRWFAQSPTPCARCHDAS